MRKHKYVDTAEWVSRDLAREADLRKRHPVSITADEAKTRLKASLASQGRLRGPDTL